MVGKGELNTSRTYASVKEAMFWMNVGDKVSCTLCPQGCVIAGGCLGKCGVRKNIDGKLMSLSWGKVIAQSLDPIEKKPLFHFWPGSMVYSIATPGCNLKCKFCQNWMISQKGKLPDNSISPEEIVKNAKRNQADGIAYTYTEPTIFVEYSIDVAKLARAEGLYNVWVSNGMIMPSAIKEVSKVIDAINIDIKGTDVFYKEYAGGVGLKPILRAVKEFHRHGVWVEITNLLIPGLNDSDKDIRDLVDFVAGLDSTIPLHFSRFHPQYLMKTKPVTPVETISKAVRIAREKLDYVYAGNIAHEAESTRCPKCGDVAIGRRGSTLHTIKGKKCSCGHEIPIVGKINK